MKSWVGNCALPSITDHIIKYVAAAGHPLVEASERIRRDKTLVRLYNPFIGVCVC